MATCICSSASKRRPFSAACTARIPVQPAALSNVTNSTPGRSPTSLRSSLPTIQVSEVSRSEEHTSELQSLMRISYAVFCLKKKTQQHKNIDTTQHHNHN